MAATYTRLGATEVLANTDTELYAPNVGDTAVIGLLHICNTSQNDATFRVAVVPGSLSSVSLADYLFYDAPITGATSSAFNIGIIIPEGYVLLVRASSVSVVFSAFGSEISN